MNRPFTVLIADRNPRIRDFLQRELIAEGHRVVTAEDAGRLKRWLDQPIQLDVLVLDPDTPGIDSDEHLKYLLTLRPQLPVVLHCISSDQWIIEPSNTQMTFVEKTGNSVDDIKQLLKRLFNASRLCKNATSPSQHCKLEGRNF